MEPHRVCKRIQRQVLCPAVVEANTKPTPQYFWRFLFQFSGLEEGHHYMSFAFSAFSSPLQDSCGSVATLQQYDHHIHIPTWARKRHTALKPVLFPILSYGRGINSTQLETHRFVIWIVSQLTLGTRPLVRSACLYLRIMPWVIKTVLEFSRPKKIREMENEQIHIRPSEPALWHLQNLATVYSIDFSLLQPWQLLVHKIGMWPFLLPVWFTHSRVLLLGKQFWNMQICLNSLLVFLSPVLISGNTYCQLAYFTWKWREGTERVSCRYVVH